MPYPLPQQPSTVGGQRVRLLPPIGCPGVEQWVLPMEFSRWAELGYRKGPIPADDLELFGCQPTAAGTNRSVRPRSSC